MLPGPGEETVVRSATPAEVSGRFLIGQFPLVCSHWTPGASEGAFMALPTQHHARREARILQVPKDPGSFSNYLRNPASKGTVVLSSKLQILCPGCCFVGRQRFTELAAVNSAFCTA